MKICPACKTSKPLEEFPVSKRRADGRGSTCLVCKRVMDRDYYSRNTERFSERNKKLIATNKGLLVEYLSENPCVDCGETDILVLEFDHRDGNPEHRVSSLLGTSRTWSVILSEIEKCDVRCANCHTRVTRKRANDWRWRLTEESTMV